jgi:hypothetical protein
MMSSSATPQTSSIGLLVLFSLSCAKPALSRDVVPADVSPFGALVTGF